MKKFKYKVLIIESERDWGQKVDEVKFFDDAEKAFQFVREFNAYNNLAQVPDWYEYATDPEMVEVDE